MALASEAYDVLVSYSRADGRHAAEIDSVLRDKGLKTFFDRRNFGAGLPWVRALEQAIGAAKAVIVLIGPRGLGNTQQYERELAFVRQTRDPAFPVVPVILPENTTDPPFDFLRVLNWIDFSHVARVSDAPDVLEELLTAIHGGKTTAEGARDAICPYRGLDAFREEDAAFLFGRGSADDPESAIGQLVRKVREHPFVMVVGRSGSGKSSLVYAGLLPALRRERDRFWNVLSLRPGPTPLRALAAAFNPRAENEGAAEYATKISNEADKLRTGDPELLSHMIREELGQAEGEPDRLLLYIDQWEELYAQAPSSGDKERAAEHAADVNRFIDLLLAASRSAPVSVVGTVRADFYDPLIGHQEIKSLLPTRQVLLGKMLRSELEQTIAEPAKKVGLTFDPPSLVQRILDEAGEDEGMLPLLQYALKETWARRRGNAMTADSYARSGGVREAIRITAERTFEALSAEDQQAARQLFLRLVTPGEGQEDTRTRAAMPVEPAQRKIVEQFAASRARLLVTGFDRAARPTVEVAHEALIRTWPRLRRWIDANREKLRSRAAILQAKAEWEQQERREDLFLPPGFQLERARALLADPGDLTITDIQEFIALSSARAETERKEREEAELRAAQELAAERSRAAEAAEQLAAEKTRAAQLSRNAELAAQVAEKRAAAERSYARAERNRALARHVSSDRKHYKAIVLKRADIFDAQADELWNAAYLLERAHAPLATAPRTGEALAEPRSGLFDLDVITPGGGCFIIRYGDPTSPNFVIIEGGDRAGYPKGLRARLATLREQMSPRTPLPVELAIVTHYDMDRVAGMRCLLEELEEAHDAGLPSLATIKSIWFNHFLPESMKTRPSLPVKRKNRPAGKEQIPRLASVLGIGLNQPYDYFVMASDRGPTRITLHHGIRATVIAPNGAWLRNWYEDWRKQRRENEDVGNTRPKDLVEQLQDDSGDQLEEAVDAISDGFTSPEIELLRAPPEILDLPTPAMADRSVANLSSIVTLFEFGGRRMLFCGDSRCDHIARGLSQAGLLPPDGRLGLDVMQVPHWGSRRNVTKEFFERVTADHYIIVPASKFLCPDEETLEMIANARGDAQYAIHLPYLASMPWLDPTKWSARLQHRIITHDYDTFTINVSLTAPTK